MAYTIYFGFLPKNTTILQRNTPVFPDSSISSCYTFDVSQISYGANGDASFVISLNDVKIERGAIECFNAFFVKHKAKNGGVETTYYTPYQIINTDYTGSINVKITGRLAPYVKELSIKDDTTDVSLQWANLNFRDTYIKYGYKYNSILKSNGSVNFSTTGATDLYCKPETPIKCDILKYSEKVKHNISSIDDDFNTICMDTLWELAYIQPNTSVFSDDQTFPRTKKRTNNNGYIELPYFITCRPINSEYTWKIAGGGQYHDVVANYDTICDVYQSYIIGKQVVPLPPFLLNTGSTETYIDEDNKIIIIGPSLSNPYISTSQMFHETASTYVWGIRINELPAVYSGSVNSTNYTNNGLFTCYLQTFTANDLGTKSKNPYVNLHTQELRLSDNLGNYYTYPLINLGELEGIGVKTYMSFDAGTTFLYTCIDTAKATGSLYNTYMGKDYRGLSCAFNNTLMWETNLLKDYMAQNKNFYYQRNVLDHDKLVADEMTGIAKNYTGNIVSAIASGGASLLVGGITSMWNKTYDTMKEQLIDYPYKIATEDTQLDNLQSAPANIKGAFNDSLMYSNNRQMGIYIDFYIADEITVNTLFQQFIRKGIYINRYVNDTDAKNYLTITNNNYDRKYLKYAQANTNVLDTTATTLTSTVECERTCLGQLALNLINGCYVFYDNDSNATLIVANSQYENNIYNLYLTDTNNYFK